MKRTMLTQCLIAAIGLALALVAAQAMAQPAATTPPGACYLNQFLPGSDAPPTQPLTEAEKAALNEAIQDEYQARATYNKILAKFGMVRPFSNIVQAEGRHVEVLAYLFERYGLDVPEDTWADKVPDYATLKEAAEAAVKAEQENGALFDRLLEKTGNPELQNVFNALKFATMQHHLPALQRLVAVENGEWPAGAGMGRGRGCGYGYYGAGPGFGRGYGRGAGWNAGPGRGRGYGAGAGWNAGPGRGRGYGAGFGRGAGWNAGAGPGRGAGLGQSWRGAGRGPGSWPGCPWYNGPVR